MVEEELQMEFINRKENVSNNWKVITEGKMTFFEKDIAHSELYFFIAFNMC